MFSWIGIRDYFLVARLGLRCAAAPLAGVGVGCIIVGFPRAPVMGRDLLCGALAAGALARTIPLVHPIAPVVAQGTVFLSAPLTDPFLYAGGATSVAQGGGVRACCYWRRCRSIVNGTEILFASLTIHAPSVDVDARFHTGRCRVNAIAVDLNIMVICATYRATAFSVQRMFFRIKHRIAIFTIPCVILRTILP